MAISVLDDFFSALTWMTYESPKIHINNISTLEKLSSKVETKIIKNKMASQPNKEINIDSFFLTKEAMTPPQLRASNPLEDSRSQYVVALDEEKKIAKEPVAAKPSSDMTMSLFKYEMAKSDDAFDGASTDREPMAMRVLEHKGVQCAMKEVAEEPAKSAIVMDED